MKRVLLKVMLWLVLSGLVVGGCAAVYLWYVWSSNLPYVGSVSEYKPPVVTRVYSRHGELIAKFWDEKRIVVSLGELPGHLIKAFIAAEDARFMEHDGIDLRGIFRAFIKNIRAGKIEQGGSTITQQVTKSLLLKNTERTYRRKAREALLAIQLEKKFSKEHILFLYLNEIYLGEGAYGVESAARTYFGKSAAELNLAESALLAGLPQAPARYSPVSHFNRAKRRQEYVLKRMLEDRLISREEFRRALKYSLDIEDESEKAFKKAPYFVEHVRRDLVDRYGRELLYKGGLRVYTTVDLRAQKLAREALRKGLGELDKREGYRGPIRHVSKQKVPDYKAGKLKEAGEENLIPGEVCEAIVEEVSDKRKETIVWIEGYKGRLPLSEMKWAREPDPETAYYNVRVKRPSKVLTEGDIILVRILEKAEDPFHWEVALEQEPDVQGALLSFLPESAEVIAMVGGEDFFESQFNRAVQARRQPGSAFKPIIYAAALDKGMSPSSVILDAPYIEGTDPYRESWKPSNYKKEFYGPTPLRTGLIKSRNVVSVKILREIGIEYAVEYAKKMGIESKLDANLSLALGSSGVSLLELTRAYAVFANGGVLADPIFITKIVDREGKVLEERHPETERVISEETAYIMTDLMKGVVQEGTGWRIKALRRPAAGKTGTTDNLRDAWFMGYVPGIVTGVWVGYDDRRVMGEGETGSRAASPIWLEFMSGFLKDRPVRAFEAPEGIVFAKINAETGSLAASESEDTVFQAYREGSEPKEQTPESKKAEAADFFQYDMQ